MKHLIRLIAVCLLFLAVARPAAAQVITQPGPEETPLGTDAYGFLSIALGMIFMPVFSAEAESREDDLTYTLRNDTAGLPGISAHVALIPAFGDNGIGLEAGYELLSFHWKQQVDSYEGNYDGGSTLAVNVMSISANYYRYFLSGADRIYLLAGGGYAWESAKLATETGDDGDTSTSSFTNWRANAGFGYLHQMHTGAIGGELRADFPLLKPEFDLDDPYGKFTVTMDRPVLLRLCVTFAIGRLR
ncbi:MAG: porin family protein [Myxococcales bacterium]|nr:porin family protein [Myxococcales bacterium]